MNLSIHRYFSFLNLCFLSLLPLKTKKNAPKSSARSSFAVLWALYEDKSVFFLAFAMRIQFLHQHHALLFVVIQQMGVCIQCKTDVGMARNFGEYLDGCFLPDIPRGEVHET